MCAATCHYVACGANGSSLHDQLHQASKCNETSPYTSVHRPQTFLRSSSSCTQELDSVLLVKNTVTCCKSVHQEWSHHKLHEPCKFSCTLQSRSSGLSLYLWKKLHRLQRLQRPLPPPTLPMAVLAKSGMHSLHQPCRRLPVCHPLLIQHQIWQRCLCHPMWCLCQRTLLRCIQTPAIQANPTLPQHQCYHLLPAHHCHGTVMGTATLRATGMATHTPQEATTCTHPPGNPKAQLETGSAMTPTQALAPSSWSGCSHGHLRAALALPGAHTGPCRGCTGACVGLQQLRA